VQRGAEETSFVKRQARKGRTCGKTKKKKKANAGDNLRCGEKSAHGGRHSKISVRRGGGRRYVGQIGRGLAKKKTIQGRKGDPGVYRETIWVFHVGREKN